MLWLIPPTQLSQIWLVGIKTRHRSIENVSMHIIATNNINVSCTLKTTMVTPLEPHRHLKHVNKMDKCHLISIGNVL